MERAHANPLKLVSDRWELVQEKEGKFATIVDANADYDESVLAVVLGTLGKSNDPFWATGWATGRLMKEAPDMLKAIRNFLEDYETWKDEIGLYLQPSTITSLIGVYERVTGETWP